MKIAFNNGNKPGFLAKLLPFLTMGIMIVLMIVGIFLFSYLLIFGAFIGLILFIISFVMGKFKKAQNAMKHHHEEKKDSPDKPKGRTYNHDDFNK